MPEGEDVSAWSGERHDMPEGEGVSAWSGERPDMPEGEGIPASSGGRPEAAGPERTRFRPATAHDAATVAALHADSWRRNYRGAYTDAFLDGHVLAERLAFWTERLREQTSDRFTILAEEAGSLVGFAYSILDEDPTWGALLDNLHIAHTHQRQGIGTRLMALTAEAILEQRPSSGLSLWVLEQNVRAQRFYEARGGRRVDRDHVHLAGGDPTRLRGEVPKLCYAWPDPAALLIAG
jgi:ribosomal protein S18 acetylase RimI-like enzyme